jgi:hypothetical protein
VSESSSQPPRKLPGSGLLGWLGRQVGHLRQAVKADVTKPPGTIYRNQKVEEVPLPQDPNVKLRRTVIDEVVVTPKDSQPDKS